MSCHTSGHMCGAVTDVKYNKQYVLLYIRSFDALFDELYPA